MSHDSVFYSRPRTYGKGSRGCRVTGDKKKSGVIRKYGLNMSRQAFREKAEDIGFKKETAPLQAFGTIPRKDEQWYAFKVARVWIASKANASKRIALGQETQSES
ncbi:hypothetical protein AC579_1184 [Pseudocercospora musae]|uniref:40S ribosomal protein S29 n=1 Tax=Pseudocercospora musae TaxID=113226 RepID=A0A139HVN4_9PEZI|nr:hypothetical protein AC579_1184 [Pseudocercospora musae]